MSTRKTVYNARAKLRKEIQQSIHPIEDVIMYLDIQFELDAIKKKFEEGTVEEITSSSSMLLQPPPKQVGMGRIPGNKTQSTEETKSNSSIKRFIWAMRHFCLLLHIVVGYLDQLPRHRFV